MSVVNLENFVETTYRVVADDRAQAVLSDADQNR